ncbi:MAG: glycosyl transferase [Rickettsiales bacterium]|nr:glycosyl transferase [Rickettsiales bacterium]|tara:strand:+ start:3846 stop:4766 length:921 start_codon:yes stop_codon:yes gene_type:complete
MISLVVPVWNEQENIIPFLSEIENHIGNENYEVIFVADPCTDKTIEIIKSQAKQQGFIKLILMSRRFGQPMAILAGLKKCSGDCAIVIDVDLQNPPSLLPKMLKLWREGNDVILPKLRKRLGESPIRSLVARIAYKTIDRFSEIKMPRNVSDFRLIDRKVINQVNLMNERHGFLRGMVAYAGFKTIYINFDRQPRLTGQTKYNPILGSLRIGGNGVFAYSSFGLSLIFNLGISLALISLLISMIYLIAKVSGYVFPWGFTTVIVSIFLVGAINMFGLAIIGQYIQRIYEETRPRPRYIIQETINLN